jgi:hypothetical protein
MQANMLRYKQPIIISNFSCTYTVDVISNLVASESSNLILYLIYYR